MKPALFLLVILFSFSSCKIQEYQERFSLGSRMLQKGMSGKDVEALNNLLIEKKIIASIEIAPKNIGQFSKMTKQAVMQFQVQTGLKPTGKVDSITLYHLKYD